MKINILRGSLVVGALALLCSVLFALPANAAYESCEKPSLCLYDGVGGTGGSLRLPLDGTATVTGSGWDNKAVSVYNNTHLWGCVYANTYLGGTVETIPPGGDGDLKTLVREVTSHKLAPSQGACFTGYERCGTGQLCIFKEPNGRGGMYGTPNDHAGYLAGVWADNVRSVMNRTEKTACFFNDASWSGEWTQTGQPVAKAYKVNAGDTTSLTAPFDRSIQSHRLRTPDADPATDKECLS
ncbi:peptidase inhibitor family I36 protein [Streptomyces sp. QHH-9511]|uniref:peptidase inhibitor family I36 protein n=1 Tax=Streptomyces sp. QHH-9511 TaxID=2684468 RepID=UPI00131AC674|nr:peptidase inhibitor family I36 protein [Streptomyces sp. QHH-9511]